MNQEKSTAPVTEPDPGTTLATMPTLNPGQFSELQTRYHKASHSTPGLTQTLALMLTGRAGWTSRQVCEFLGCNPTQLNGWIGDYRTSGVASISIPPG